VDDLTLLRSRLKELVDAKIERITALKAEIAAIEGELDEAKAILGTWGQPVAAAPVAPAESTYDRRRREHKEKRQTHVIKMRRPDVLAYLTSVGPQDSRRILAHFDVGPRGAAIFQVWTNAGFLVRHADGRYAAPPEPAKTSGPVSSLEPLPEPALRRFA
jgi:hypothetical protein